MTVELRVISPLSSTRKILDYDFSSFSSIMDNLRRPDQIENIHRITRYLRDRSNLLEELRGHDKIFGILFFHIFLENKSILTTFQRHTVPIG